MKKAKKKELKKQKKLEKERFTLIKKLRRLRSCVETLSDDKLEDVENQIYGLEARLSRVSKEISTIKEKIKKVPNPKKSKSNKPKKRNKEEQRQVKTQLILECGTVDMWDMTIYDERKLTLHHDPPHWMTRHTVFEESFLLTRPNHDKLEYAKHDNPAEYDRMMQIIKANKETLIKTRKLEGVPSDSPSE